MDFLRLTISPFDGQTPFKEGGKDPLEWIRPFDNLDATDEANELLRDDGPAGKSMELRFSLLPRLLPFRTSAVGLEPV